MSKNVEMIRNAREIINKIIQGKDPINQVEIESNSFLNESKILRCFSFITDISSENGGYRIGAAVTGAELGEHAEVKKAWPGVVECGRSDGR